MRNSLDCAEVRITFDVRVKDRATPLSIEKALQIHETYRIGRTSESPYSLIGGNQDLLDRLIEKASRISFFNNDGMIHGATRHKKVNSVENVLGEKIQTQESRAVAVPPIHFPSPRQTSLRFDLLDHEQLLQNPFLQEYTSLRVEDLPAFDSRNHARQERAVDVEHWTEDHVKSCRAVPFPGVDLQKLLGARYFELTHEGSDEQGYVDDFARHTLEELTDPETHIDIRRNKFRGALEGLSMCLSSGCTEKEQGQAILAEITEPIFQLLAAKHQVSFTSISL
ncbi:hypothetical protein BT69DRAFT_1315088 [Atractiella rhizophila]|nr:hypothetical protein BT69DRAFT_1315088 [Atractiella rhizophila]